MNATTKQEGAALVPSGLALLREPVPDNLISSKPNGTKSQNECDPRDKVNCQVCGGRHHPDVRHLDYVGHAATTHRILDADPLWNWEPLSLTPQGLPLLDADGGLWIKLTVCGVTRLAYGSADKKAHMNAGALIKELIGDAIRNGAMRFGFALDLWSKANLHDTGSEERNKWFWACVDGIKASANVGELKARTAAAIDQARERGDQEAEDDFLIAQAEKMSRARKPAPAIESAPKVERPAAATKSPHDLNEDDFPF